MRDLKRLKLTEPKLLSGMLILTKLLMLFMYFYVKYAYMFKQWLITIVSLKPNTLLKIFYIIEIINYTTSYNVPLFKCIRKQLHNVQNITDLCSFL